MTVYITIAPNNVMNIPSTNLLRIKVRIVTLHN
jgi:hypothetical protein